ncbi:hypothetical protein L1987_29771 [Smallanthus sonchifolius]|uniref:Uncharacterized protein n=1 Tax=Smallanthus sonchifolius TaxID=185202 RepID=A0ACB9I284_9ASTR|nr:hypothetical protein L1987_29771 [Smallanthus sonchifolius]
MVNSSVISAHHSTSLLQILNLNNKKLKSPNQHLHFQIAHPNLTIFAINSPTLFTISIFYNQILRFRGFGILEN